MAFSNKEMKEATQIAYLSILEKANANLEAEGKKPPYSLEEMILSVIDVDAAKERFAKRKKIQHPYKLPKSSSKCGRSVSARRIAKTSVCVPQPLGYGKPFAVRHRHLPQNGRHAL